MSGSESSDRAVRPGPSMTRAAEPLMSRAAEIAIIFEDATLDPSSGSAALRPASGNAARDATCEAAWRAFIADPESLVERAACTALIEGAACAALARPAGSGAAGDDPLEVSILLGSDALLQQLNLRWRGKDRPTNVLAFPADAPDLPGTPRLLGDVAIALETLLREAGAAGLAPADHLTHLVVHGILHLLGHDHEVEAEAERMEALEVRILDSLGVADPYGGHPDPSATMAMER